MIVLQEINNLAPSGSDFVDMPERTAPDEVVLNLMAHSVEVAHANGDASAQVCLWNCMCTLAFVRRTYHSFRLLLVFRF